MTTLSHHFSIIIYFYLIFISNFGHWLKFFVECLKWINVHVYCFYFIILLFYLSIFKRKIKYNNKKRAIITLLHSISITLIIILPSFIFLLNIFLVRMSRNMEMYKTSRYIQYFYYTILFSPSCSIFYFWYLKFFIFVSQKCRYFSVYT